MATSDSLKLGKGSRHRFYVPRQGETRCKVGFFSKRSVRAASGERGEWIAAGVGDDQLAEVGEQRAALLAAGGGGRERAFGESLAGVALGAERHFAVDDEAPDGLRELRRSLPAEVVVVEPSHPLAGRTVAVEGLRTVRGERCLLVRLPDGSASTVALSATSAGGRGARVGGGALLSPAGVRRLRALLVAAGTDHRGA